MAQSRFQIGSDKYQYIYSDANLQINGKPVYRCRRGVETSPDGYVLWLRRTAQGHWIAREATSDSDEPVQEGRSSAHSGITLMTLELLVRLRGSGGIQKKISG